MRPRLTREPDGDANRHEEPGFADNHPHHVTALGPERHPNAQLARPLHQRK